MTIVESTFWIKEQGDPSFPLLDVDSTDWSALSKDQADGLLKIFNKRKTLNLEKVIYALLYCIKEGL